MRGCSLILLVLLGTLTGCIVTYRDFPIVNPLPIPYEPAAPPRCRQAVKILADFVWTDRELNALQEALQNYGRCSSSSPVVYNSKWAETEVWVSAENKPSSTWGRTLGGGAYFLLPVYSGQGGWVLSYSVYDRNALKKTYQYEITKKEFYWLLVLPFSWINLFTYSLDDAVRSTTAQFVVDAQRDGYLGTKE